MTCKKADKALFRKTAATGVLLLVAAVLLFAALCPSAGAAGLVEDTVDAAHEYSRYPLENYQLDFYVDNGWDWLPWNWIDGIGRQVMYGLYCITNFIWTINLYLSSASGYLVQEAYSLDFISDAADAVGRNIQAIAGISPSGLSSDGFYAGFLLLIILIVGAYAAYTGIIRRETTKAVRAALNMVLVFVLSGALIAYAPDCVRRLNEFSEDISTASLSVGTKIVMPDTDNSGGDSVSLIRDSLFSIQVKQPWLLLQFGDTDTDMIGADRVESLISASPSENNGESRENAVKAEIEDNGNTNLTVTKAVNRLGTVFFLFLFNIGISFFVFLLTGMMLFSQVLFIIYAMFLPAAFVLSMAPTFEGTGRRAVIKLFNTIFARAGITLVITIAFSISSMLYRISSGYPFFIIAFLQVVVFAGVYFKLGDLLSMFSLHDDGARGMGRYIMHRPRMFLYHQLHRLNRTMRAAGRANESGGKQNGHAGYTAGSRYSGGRRNRPDSARAWTGNTEPTLPEPPVKGAAGGTGMPPQGSGPASPAGQPDRPDGAARESRIAGQGAAYGGTEVPAQSEPAKRQTAPQTHERPAIVPDVSQTGQAPGVQAQPPAPPRQARPAAEDNQQKATAAGHAARQPETGPHERPAVIPVEGKASGAVRRLTGKAQERAAAPARTGHPPAPAADRPAVRRDTPDKPAAGQGKASAPEQDRPVVSRPAVKPAARMKAAPPHRQEAYNKAGRITQGKKGASPESRAGGAEKGGGK
ncbi:MULTISPECIES: CD3337/EF1877 family mobilome membrane protein [Agathobaculum]|uniref:CD3337/EF1877 family mobilome membrane protein n=1 Tax=Agathobaculum TaxID=2048137 RepID=UPI001FA8FCD0|nr:MULTISPECIES: YtxH domain-containing protein [Agathobaculum]